MENRAIWFILLCTLTSGAMSDDLPPPVGRHHRHDDHVTTVCVQVRGSPASPVCGPIVDPPPQQHEQKTVVEEAARLSETHPVGPEEAHFVRQMMSQRAQMSPNFEAVPVYKGPPFPPPSSFRASDELSRPHFAVNSQPGSVVSMFRASEPLQPQPHLRDNCNDQSHHLPMPQLPINPAPRYVSVGIPPPMPPPILIETGPPMAAFPPLNINNRGSQMRQAQQQFLSQGQQFSNQWQPMKQMNAKEACVDDFQMQQQKMRTFAPGRAYPPQVSGTVLMRESENKAFLEKQCEEHEKIIEQKNAEINKLHQTVSQMSENKAMTGSTTKNFERKDVVIKSGNGKTETSINGSVSSSMEYGDKSKRGTGNRNSDEKTASS